MTSCERTRCFLGCNLLIFLVLWSYFAFGSQNRVIMGRQVVPSRAFTRQVCYLSARVTLAALQMHSWKWRKKSATATVTLLLGLLYLLGSRAYSKLSLCVFIWFLQGTTEHRQQREKTKQFFCHDGKTTIEKLLKKITSKIIEWFWVASCISVNVITGITNLLILYSLLLFFFCKQVHGWLYACCVCVYYCGHLGE